MPMSAWIPLRRVCCGPRTPPRSWCPTTPPPTATPPLYATPPPRKNSNLRHVAGDSLHRGGTMLHVMTSTTLIASTPCLKHRTQSTIYQSNNTEASGSTKPAKRRAKFFGGGKIHPRKRRLGAPNVQNHCTNLDKIHSTYDSIQESPENKSDEIISETFENQTMSYGVGMTESRIVNWPSGGECEGKVDARIAEISSDHDVVQILYNEIS
ncbi:hypothetical protein PR048_017620 [Dryococelus australis]|uniref:Uncharacterized protein n=1 Tax=Dryococelus australis TaxID=614101 RepID=A0ABQ9HA07_9NEOP|nr:hypothetical protein PR048_017620 [Dryococelus australis]